MQRSRPSFCIERLLYYICIVLNERVNEQFRSSHGHVLVGPQYLKAPSRLYGAWVRYFSVFGAEIHITLFAVVVGIDCESSI